MDIIKHTDVEAALAAAKRVYLCGDLAAPNGLEHIPTDGFELGLSDYDTFTAEAAHLHTKNHEYNYILSGELKVYIPEEGREYILVPGDLYVIRPNMTYATKAVAGTRVLFAKTPGGNDKVLDPAADEHLARWRQSFDAEVQHASSQ